jgi:hypothetical protein
MDKMDIYNAVRVAPREALKTIGAGRLKGMSDINPMWRIKTLTQEFGPCGIGWRYEITKQWTEQGSNDQIVAFCNIDLFVKIGDEWSAAIPGTGGSDFVTKERSGLYTSNECYKMALTDAISVACKSLGVAADVYWAKDPTKYTQPEQKGKIDSGKVNEISNLLKQTKSNVPIFLKYYHLTKVEDMTDDIYRRAERDLMSKLK